MMAGNLGRFTVSKASGRPARSSRRAQQEAAAGHDLGEALQQLVQPPAGEVRGVVPVAVVVLADPVPLEY